MNEIKEEKIETQEVVKEEVAEENKTEEPKRRRRRKTEAAAVETVVEETPVEEVKTEETATESPAEEPKAEEPKQEIRNDKETEKVKKEQRKPHITVHNFVRGDKVFVVYFGEVRDSKGFTKLINSYRRYPLAAEIESVIITDKVRYKLVGKAGSLVDEEDVCYTEEEAIALCKKKNNGEF